MDAQTFEEAHNVMIDVYMDTCDDAVVEVFREYGSVLADCRASSASGGIATDGMAEMDRLQAALRKVATGVLEK